MPDFSGKMDKSDFPFMRNPVNLPKILSEIRALRGHTLRAVEEATGISNAYLSQLERGDAQKPSPDKLKALAEFYDVPYTDLLRAAGYLQKMELTEGSGNERASAVHAALMSAKLTPEEEAAVVKYIQFLRFQNKK
jgi:transcriptional regulator with XRE-family HTH domain